MCKVALVTGANRGIGLETARHLGLLGFEVLVGSRLESTGKEIALRLRDEGVSAYHLLIDLDDPGTHRHAAELIERTYDKLDVLVNNAAICLDTPDRDLAVPSGAHFGDICRRTFATNVFGVIDLTMSLLPAILRSPRGRIVNVSSDLGSLTLLSNRESPLRTANMPAYSMSKTALNAFTVHLANSLRHTQVKVNAAHPGWVRSDLGGPDAPEEIESGAITSVSLATLPDDGPSGCFFHFAQELPW